MAEQVDAVVIGAGVVGLAVARALALAGREVLVLESERSIGSGVSSRNSEVIHAGLYYRPSSLKGKLCVAGNRMLITGSAPSTTAFAVEIPSMRVESWDTKWNRRLVRPVGEHLVAATLFDGVVVQPRMMDSALVGKQ